MVFKYWTFIVDDDFLNTRPGSPPAFSPSPSVASPRACRGCIGVISRFDESQLRDRSRDEGTADEKPDENGSAGKATRNAKKQVKEVGLLGKAVEVLDAIGGTVTFSRSTIKEPMPCILAFEVANTIAKGANLMQSLLKKHIVWLKEEMLPSEGVQCLVSTDKDELLRIAAADYRKELKSFTKEVVRFGNRLRDPQFHNLDLRFKMMELGHLRWTPSRKDAWAVMLSLMDLLPSTAELYQEFCAWDRCYNDYEHKMQEYISLDAKDNNFHYIQQGVSILRSELRSHKRQARSLKKKSVWSRSLGEVVEKLVYINVCLHLEILETFGSADQEIAAGGSASNGRKLGSSGLDLHYASIITLIDTIVAHSGSVAPAMTNALYHSLPPGIKSTLHFWLRQVQIQEEHTIPVIKSKMEKTLLWLAPIAANTIKASYDFARQGIWANIRSSLNQRAAGKDDFIRLNTLYHADKEITESYIVELLFWLHQLVRKQRAMNDGVTCSLDSAVYSLSGGEIQLTSLSLRGCVSKRKLMPVTSENLECKTENPHSCYSHLPSSGICDSPTNGNPGVSILIVKILSMNYGIDMMTALDVIDGITVP